MLTNDPLCLARAAIIVMAAAAPAIAETTPIPHVETRGTGPIEVVLVPGLACDWTVWDAFMDRNADRYTMHAVTLPGFGGTTSPPAPVAKDGTPWLDNAVEALSEYMGDNDLVGAHVVGHSLGGLVAYRMATEKPDVTGKAISVDGLPAFPLGGGNMSKGQRVRMVEDMIAPQMLAVTDEQWWAQQDQMMKSMVTGDERTQEITELARKTPGGVAAQYMIELMKTDVRDELAWVDEPVLIIAALPADVPQMPAEVVRTTWGDMVGGTEQVELVYAEGSRHFVMDDAPEFLDQQVARFLVGEEEAADAKREALSIERPNKNED
ncbi:MAG: alpha/beta hydrolase [Planctomycetota bacterium]